MPMKMGIHCKPIGHSHSASRHSRVRGDDGGMVFPRKRLSPANIVYGRCIAAAINNIWVLYLDWIEPQVLREAGQRPASLKI